MGIRKEKASSVNPLPREPKHRAESLHTRKVQIGQILVAAGVPAEEAEGAAGALADLYGYNAGIMVAVDELSEVPTDSSWPVVRKGERVESCFSKLGINLDILERHLPRIQRGIDAVGRRLLPNTTIFPTTEEEYEEVKRKIEAWWPRQDTRSEGARRLTELRLLSREASITLSASQIDHPKSADAAPVDILDLVRQLELLASEILALAEQQASQQN